MPRSTALLSPLPNTHSSREAQRTREVADFAALRAANPNSALTHGLELVKRLRDENAQSALATCLRHLGSILAETGNPQAGLKHVVESETIFRQIGDVQGIVAALAVQATCLTAQGMYQRALRNSLSAMRLARESSLRDDVARLSSGLGNLYRMTGKTQLAVLTYRSGMRLASRLKLRDVYLAGLNNVAMCALDIGDYSRALRLASRALRFCAVKPGAGGSSAMEGYVKHTLGEALFACGKLDDSMHMMRDAYAIARARNLSTVERKCAIALGRIGIHQGDFDFAKEYLDLAHFSAIDTDDRHAILEISLLQAQVVSRDGQAANGWIARSLTSLNSLDHALKMQRREVLEFEQELEEMREDVELGRIKQVELAARLNATQRRAQELAVAANTDALTGLRNRRALSEFVDAVLNKPSREPYSILMFDIDRFKAINDAFGHPVGDHALALLAGSVHNILRAGDEFFRYGGDEFIVIATGRGAGNGVRLAEEITRVARALSPSNIDPVSISVSVGVVYVPAVTLVDWADVMERVDASLLQAKAQGRGCIVGQRLTPASLRSVN